VKVINLTIEWARIKGATSLREQGQAFIYCKALPCILSWVYLKVGLIQELLLLFFFWIKRVFRELILKIRSVEELISVCRSFVDIGDFLCWVFLHLDRMSRNPDVAKARLKVDHLLLHARPSYLPNRFPVKSCRQCCRLTLLLSCFHYYNYMV